MTSQAVDDPFEDDTPPVGTTTKAGARALARTAKQAAKQEQVAQRKELTEQSKQLAQIVNLMIAGYSLGDIALATGHTEAEMDRLLQRDMARYVRNQPALRVFVRNFISSKYMGLLDAVWDQATDEDHPEKLENQDRALRILNSMGRLHGAEAPTQAEVKVEASSETVEKMVAALAAKNGQMYDDGIFDVIDAEVVHEAAQASELELERSGAQVGDDQPGDEDFTDD